jgi:hypothetical protein
VESLTNEQNEMLWQSITVIEAQEALVGMKLVAFPHMKKEQADQTHRSLHRLAFPDVYSKPVEISAESMARLING